MTTWLEEYKKQYAGTFHMPTRKDERWKYTPIEHCLSCHPEERSDEGSTTFRAPKILCQFAPQDDRKEVSPQEDNVLVCSIAEGLAKYPSLIRQGLFNIDAKKHPFAGLHLSQFSDGLFIHVPDNTSVTNPIYLNNQSTVIIMLGKQSSLTIIEEPTTNTNKVTQIYLGDSAQLHYYKIKKTAITELAHTFVEQQANSASTFTNFVLGAQFSRDELAITLSGTNSSCHTVGFYHLRNANQYVDNHIDVTHKAPHTKSEMLFKGILENKSTAVFNGRLHVAKSAQKILAHQANHNLLLSNQAEVYSKPELEIYADDVKCKHGASTGQLDEDALFYLRARGIPLVDAQRMLLAGFADEILQRVTHSAVKEYLRECLPC